MRQILLLNILLLGLLVGLFCSVYGKLKLPRVRLWIIGWLCILVHFAASLAMPVEPFLANLVMAVSLASLMLSGLVFLLSVARDQPAGIWYWLRLFGIAVPLIFVVCASWNIQASIFLALLNFAGHTIALILIWNGYGKRRWIVCLSSALLLGCYHWLLYLITFQHSDDCLNVILMEIFALYAVLFFADFSRFSAGVVTSIGGLLLWALVFPVGWWLALHRPDLHVNSEVWNVPKVVVAFGMLLTLFEDEVLLAQKEREQYKRLFDRTPLPMWIYDRDSLRILNANQAALREFGWRPDRDPSPRVEDLLVQGETQSALDWSGETSDAMAEVSTVPARFRKENGVEVRVEIALEPVDFQGRAARLLLAQDVTEKLRMQEQLIHQANHDPLTGLPNRLLLQDRLSKSLAMAARHGTRVAVLCLDLDRFKRINDTLGHSAGDSCLREVARRLKARLRTVDTVARIGGEEFLVVLDDVHMVSDIRRVADDILAGLGASHIFEGRRIALSASMGIALYPEDGQTADELWERSDVAMYRAKQAGGNRYHFFHRGER